MPDGFFSKTELELYIPAPQSTIPKCGACGLLKGCRSPKMVPYGKGKRKVLIVGEAPGETEDRLGRPFVGKAGQYLRNSARKCGVNIDEDCWTTNALICRPPNNVIGDRKRIDYCRPNIYNTIKELKPKVVILLGLSAVESVIGWLWKSDVGNMGRWVGWQIPSQEVNAWVCPTYHPSYILRENERYPVYDLIFDQHLKEAFDLEGRPWSKVPNFPSKVEVIFDTEEAADKVYDMAKDNKLVAFDYETNMLKPDSKRASIYCCSVSDGKKSIAFPWQGDCIRVMGSLLRSSSIKKIAANMKFEDRWTRAAFGFGVEGWAFDTMLAAHVLDNRPDISGLKFQAFAHLGQKEYDPHITKFLKARGKFTGGYTMNNIQAAPKRDLMFYCGMDSLIEYKLAIEQAQKLGVKL